MAEPIQYEPPEPDYLLETHRDTVCYDCLGWDESHGISEYTTALYDRVNSGELKLIPRQPNDRLCCDYWLKGHDYIWIDTEVA